MRWSCAGAPGPKIPDFGLDDLGDARRARCGTVSVAPKMAQRSGAAASVARVGLKEKLKVIRCELCLAPELSIAAAAKLAAILAATPAAEQAPLK